VHSSIGPLSGPGRNLHDDPLETRKNNFAAADVARILNVCSAETHLGVLGASWLKRVDECRPGKQECSSHVASAANVKLFLRVPLECAIRQSKLLRQ